MLAFEDYSRLALIKMFSQKDKKIQILGREFWEGGVFMKKKVFIEGMSCQHCVNHVTEVLKEITGVKAVDVDLEGKYAIVEADLQIDDGEIKNAIEEAGYEVVKIE